MVDAEPVRGAWPENEGFKGELMGWVGSGFIVTDAVGPDDESFLKS